MLYMYISYILGHTLSSEGSVIQHTECVGPDRNLTVLRTTQLGSDPHSVSLYDYAYLCVDVHSYAYLWTPLLIVCFCRRHG